MPASRSARAMTLAPRSWPSRPGLAMTTRIFCIYDQTPDLKVGRYGSLDQWNLFVLTPDFTKRVAHFAHGRVRADAVHERVHRVAGAARGLLQHVERAPHRVGVARRAQV